LAKLCQCSLSNLNWQHVLCKNPKRSPKCHNYFNRSYLWSTSKRTWHIEHTCWLRFGFFSGTAGLRPKKDTLESWHCTWQFSYYFYHLITVFFWVRWLLHLPFFLCNFIIHCSGNKWILNTLFGKCFIYVRHPKLCKYLKIIFCPF
jgi:hypothetical protein